MLVRHPLVDEILDAHRDIARGQEAAFEGYRNHAHHIVNFARAIATLSPEDEEKIAIAAAFHDLHVFDGMDYLEPSIESAGAWLRETGRETWDREIAFVIALHHRVRPYRGEFAHLVEPFRRADWNDVSRGLVRGGIPREVRRAADEQFPAGEFLGRAVPRAALGWLRRHPTRPAPPFRGGAALRRSGRA